MSRISLKVKRQKERNLIDGSRCKQCPKTTKSIFISNFKICLICGAIQTINDTEKRIQTHL